MILDELKALFGPDEGVVIYENAMRVFDVFKDFFDSGNLKGFSCSAKFNDVWYSGFWLSNDFVVKVLKGRVEVNLYMFGNWVEVIDDGKRGFE